MLYIVLLWIVYTLAAPWWIHLCLWISIINWLLTDDKSKS